MMALIAALLIGIAESYRGWIAGTLLFGAQLT